MTDGRAVSASEASVVGAPFRVALTFDAEHADRPAATGATERLLDALAAEAVTSTFFVQGRWAQAEPALARHLADDGHLVGNHSHHHARMTILTRAGIARDLRAAEAAIRAATGVDPRPWFRCPFGAGAGTERVTATLAAAGYVDVGWNVDGRDWAGGSASALEARVVRLARAQGDGAVVLLHGWPSATPIAVPRIVRRLRDLGAEFVRIDALDAFKGPQVASARPDEGTPSPA